MGRGHGGTGRSTWRGGGMSASDVLAKYPEIEKRVKDASVRQGIVEAIQDMEREFGVTPDSLKFYNRKDNTAGRQSETGETSLNLKYLADSAESQKVYANGYHPAGTEKNPAKATMVHELAHKIEFKHGGYGSNMSKELDKAYSDFLSGWRQGRKNNPAAHSLGGQSTLDKSEYFAEALSGYMSGLRNQYTTAAYKIAKKYRK